MSGRLPSLSAHFCTVDVDRKARLISNQMSMVVGGTSVWGKPPTPQDPRV